MYVVPVPLLGVARDSILDCVVDHFLVPLEHKEEDHPEHEKPKDRYGKEAEGLWTEEGDNHIRYYCS